MVTALRLLLFPEEHFQKIVYTYSFYSFSIESFTNELNLPSPPQGHIAHVCWDHQGPLCSKSGRRFSVLPVLFTALNAKAHRAHGSTLFSMLPWQDPLLIFPYLSRHPLQKEALTSFLSSTRLCPTDHLTCSLGPNKVISNFLGPNLSPWPPLQNLFSAFLPHASTWDFHMPRCMLQKCYNYYGHLLLSPISLIAHFQAQKFLPTNLFLTLSLSLCTT